MTTADDAAPPCAWIRRAEEEGRRGFVLAGALQAAATGGSVVLWLGIALLVGSALAGSGARPWPVLLVVAGGVGAAVARRGADRAADAGGRRVLLALRREALERVLPERRAARIPSSQAGDAVLDLPVALARAARTTAPLHVSLPLSMGLVLVVIAIAWWPVAVILIAATALMPLNLRVVGAAAAREAADQRVAASRLASLVLDTIRGQRELRMLGALERRRRRVEDESRRTDRATMALLRRAFVSGAVTDALVTFAIAVAATTAGLELLRYLPAGLLPRVDLARALLVLTLCPLYFAPIRLLSAAYHDRDVAAAARSELAGLPADDPPRTTATASEQPVPPPPTASGALSPDERPGGVGRCPVPVTIRLSGLRAELDERVVVRAADLSATAGWTAVTGPSGSGKSTLLAAAVGLIPGSAGSVTWERADRSTPPSWGDVSWLGQRTVLLDATLAENARLGSRDADDLAVAGALRTAGLGHLVDELPLGIETPVGPSGRPLSHGEARRLCLARAVLRDASVWVLDEPDAHLDDRTRDEVLASIRVAAGRRTVLVATHDVEVAGAADQVWEIDRDRVVRERR